MLINKNKVVNINLKINNQIIERVQHTTYLGIIINEAGIYYKKLKPE